MNLMLKKATFLFYDLAWGLAIPALRRNQRLAEGFDQRMLRNNVLKKSDLWIHAASAGESYLAWSLLKNLNIPARVRILVTSDTRQGMEILERAIEDIAPDKKNMKVYTAYFPFDRPVIMEAAVRKICPKIMVLLELEIWPGMLSALKKYGSKILIVNGRITAKSLKRYLLWPSFWHCLTPDKILAISENDVRRFAMLFGKKRVRVMPNMKFDRLGSSEAQERHLLDKILPSDKPLIVLGSTRQEEEPLIEKIILRLCTSVPEAIIGLFPRHMHRINHWETVMERTGVSWILRSEIENKDEKSASHRRVILWDTFGELTQAYERSKAVFVGGSLAHLGGQNFLEPLICGVIPVIGPSWENFAWVGREILEQGLVRVATNWKEVADILAENVRISPPHKKIRKAALNYVKKRQGGTATACRLIGEWIS